jgi:hypothetical protein
MKIAQTSVVLAVCALLVAGLSCSSGSATYQLTTVIEGQGNVSPGSGAFASGSIVTLTASAASGWGFSHWGGNSNGSENILNITMDSDKTIYAYFTNSSMSISTPTATPASGYGALMVQSSPSGADVYIDGVDTGGNTPYVGKHISIGNHSIRLIYPHYKWRTEQITITGGETANINWVLDWAPSLDVVIQPDGSDGKDSSVYAWKPFENYGDNSSLNIGGNTVGTLYRTFIQFNISIIPPTAVITDAKLGLYYDWAYETTTEGRIALYNVQQAWDEDDIAWDGQPSTRPSPWLVTAIPGYATEDFLYLDIGISNVQKWINGSLYNYGIMLRDYDESDAEGLRSFPSSENVDADSRPKLVIQYYDPVGWVPLSFAETHPDEAAYMSVHDDIQDAVAAYAADHAGSLPILNAHRTVDECTDCHIIDIGALLTSNGGLLSDVPDGCYGSTVIAGTNDNCDGGFGVTGCSPSSHYLWLVDSWGYAYSKCEGNGCASNSQSGYQQVWP